MAKPILPQDLKELLDLIRKGRLYDLQNWIKAGRQVRVPEVDYRGHILRIAVKVGFHNFVEDLLIRVSN